jgi:hypothetical protein
MQNTIWTKAVLFIGILGLLGCDNELDVAADWKEIAIVYGAINPSVDKNYVRIQRAYLDETTSALAFSSLRDSLYFDSLVVYVDEFQNGQFTQRIDLSKVDGNLIGIPKDTGIFYSDENILYELNAVLKASLFATDWSYRLTIQNPKTGYIATATTSSLGNIQARSPISPTGGSVYISANNNHVVPVIFQEAKHARAYRVAMNIVVEETKIDNPSEKEIKNLEWVLINSGKTKELRGFNDANYKVLSAGFFATLKSNLEVDNTVERRLVSYDLAYYGISDDFNTFLSVLQPSNTIVKKKPEFTNIDNGLGIFTSRNITIFDNRIFNATILPEIQSSPITEDLGFVK